MVPLVGAAEELQRGRARAELQEVGVDRERGVVDELGDQLPAAAGVQRFDDSLDVDRVLAAAAAAAGPGEGERDDRVLARVAGRVDPAAEVRRAGNRLGRRERED